MTATKVPNLPAISESNLADALRSVKNLLDVREGRTGNPLDSNVTFRDLILSGNAIAASGGNSAQIIMPPWANSDGYDPTQDFSAPLSPTGFILSSGMATILLKWDAATNRNHSYTEIWRSETNVIGNASLIGTSDSRFYSDAVGVTSKTYYYWIRFVSQANVSGPYNATNGTYTSTGMVGGQDLSDLIITSSKLVDSAVTATKIANLAVGNAAIANLAVTNAKIADLAVDNAKISTLDAAKITTGFLSAARIQAGSIDAKIANLDAATITSGTISAARIGAASINTAAIANAAITTALIQDSAITNAKIANLAVGSAKIADGSITNAKIADAQITSAKIAAASIGTALIQDGAITNALIAYAAIDSAKIGDAQVGTLKIAGNSVSFGGAIVSGGSVGFYTPVGGILAVIAYSGGSYGASLDVYSDAGSDSFPVGPPKWIFGESVSQNYIEAYGPCSGIALWGMGAGGHYVGFGQSGQAYNAARIIWLFFQR